MAETIRSRKSETIDVALADDTFPRVRKVTIVAMRKHKCSRDQLSY